MPVLAWATVALPMPAPPDSGRPMDAGAADSGPTDAAMDSGTSDDAATDAGTLDSGPPDAGVRPSLCDSVLSDAMFCSSFERSDLFPWGIDSATGTTVEQTTSMQHRGGAALRIATSGGSGGAEVFLNSVGGIATGSLYARGYYYVPTGSSFDYLVLLSFNEGVAPFGTINVAFVPGPRLAVPDRTDVDRQRVQHGSDARPSRPLVLPPGCDRCGG